MQPGTRLAKRVLLIGWDAADWQLIDKYVAQGAMPFMQEFLKRGSRGNLATLKPVLSPMLWNSIATGKRPYKHGIHGFTEPMPDGKGVRPSTSTTRKCKAIWNMLTQAGMTANVVSWFVGHPAEPISGICISDMFQKVAIDKQNPASTELPPLPDGCVHPTSLRDKLADLRLHPGELTAGEILPFIPQATQIDQAKDGRLTMFARLFAEMVSVHNAATFVMEQNDWDFMGVYYDAIDHFGHGFMEYHPPRMDHVSERDFEIYQHVVEGCYRFHDLILGRLIALAGEETTIVLCSDHGYLSDHLRPKETPQEPAGPAAWHRDYGVLAMAGPGIKKGEEILGASLLDITPTVLTLLGLPVGEDMDGKVLTHVIDNPWGDRAAPIPSWEDVPGDSGMHPKDKQEDPFAAREALRQLVELGYIEEPDKDAEKAARNAAREANYNLARAYQDGGRLDDAAKLLEALYAEYPDQTRFGMALARTRMHQRRFDEVRQLAEEIVQRVEATNRLRADRMEELIKTIDEQPEQVIARAKEAQQRNHAKQLEAERVKAKAEGREPLAIESQQAAVDDEFLAKRKRSLQAAAKEIREHDVRAAPNVNLLLGRLEAINGDFEKALQHLSKAEQSDPRLPTLHLHLGQTYLRMRRNEDAVRAFQKALQIDPDNAQAHEGLGTALTRLHRYEAAIDHALRAVELLHELPSAHLRLGVTLARLSHFERAAEAFETCLKLAPRTPAAHRWLASLYESQLHRPDRAFGHRNRLKEVLQEIREGRAQHESIRTIDAEDVEIPADMTATDTTTADPSVMKAIDQSQVITVVTGLPRTGTSMMMQMLVAGGMEPLTDGNRMADASNPKGYFELDKATRLRTDSSWIGEAKGKVVKIVAQLLTALPDEANGTPALYRVVFMDRDLDEVLASQHKMLEIQGRTGADLDRDRLASVFKEQLQKVKAFLADRQIACHTVRHAQVIKDPRSAAESLNNFFGGILDTDAMVQAVDPTLHREKTRHD